MEIKINREIRNYTESVLFGLSLRQCICSACAVGAAMGVYFGLRPHLGPETVSWVCVLGAAPFAGLGFFQFNGMPAEKFLWVWVKAELLMPKRLLYHSTNRYYELLKPQISRCEKEAMKKHDQNTFNHLEGRPGAFSDSSKHPECDPHSGGLR